MCINICSNSREFQIGVEIHRGRGGYQNTRVVTFVARYQLENRTQYHLAYLQRHQLRQQVSDRDSGYIFLKKSKKVKFLIRDGMW